MFIQVIEGKTKDPDALQRRIELWDRELRPGAIGYLGSTGGCTSSGDVILIARFESRDAARRNSERPAQSTWWQETEKCFDGPVMFHDTDDVHVMQHGDLDKARFVQVMDGHVSDHDRALEVEHEADPLLAELRPELLGAVTAFHGDDAYTEIAYFTSEAEARQGEQRAVPEKAAMTMAAWNDVMTVDRYFDIPRPWLGTKLHPVE